VPYVLFGGLVERRIGACACSSTPKIWGTSARHLGNPSFVQRAGRAVDVDAWALTAASSTEVRVI
jgi:hypothetical protein